MFVSSFFFFQAEDGIRDLVRSRGLGDVYKRQGKTIGAYDDPAATRWIDANIPNRKAVKTYMGPGLSLIHI